MKRPDGVAHYTKLGGEYALELYDDGSWGVHLVGDPLFMMVLCRYQTFTLNHIPEDLQKTLGLKGEETARLECDEDDKPVLRITRDVPLRELAGKGVVMRRA